MWHLQKKQKPSGIISFPKDLFVLYPNVRKCLGTDSVKFWATQSALCAWWDNEADSSWGVQAMVTNLPSLQGLQHALPAMPGHLWRPGGVKLWLPLTPPLSLSGLWYLPGRQGALKEHFLHTSREDYAHHLHMVAREIKCLFTPTLRLAHACTMLAHSVLFIETHFYNVILYVGNESHCITQLILYQDYGNPD